MTLDYNKANDNIVQDTKDLIFDQFENADNIQKIAEIIAEEAGSYEEIAEKVFTAFLLTEAEGFALDSIGEFLNIPREDQDDDTYRTTLVVAAIGSNLSITRDPLSRLLDILTKGIGGYFVKGAYHDVYVYLQDACVSREVAGEFLDRYLPTNTQASILFESGTSFGFEGNALAAGFDRVYQRSSEGDVFLRSSYSGLRSSPTDDLDRAYVLTKGVYEYRTEYSYSLLNRIAAITWNIPASFVAGDVVSISMVDQITREEFGDTLTIATTPTAQDEIATFLIDFVVNNNIAAVNTCYVDDSIVYLGYEEATPPLVDPVFPVGFPSTYTLEISAKTLAGLDIWCKVGASNTTRGEIPVAFADQFMLTESLPYIIEDVRAAPEWFDGFGPLTIVPEESTANSGDFCTRVSLTTRDILNFSNVVEDSFEYELDAKLFQVIPLLEDADFKKSMQVVEPFREFRGPEWDNSLLDLVNFPDKTETRGIAVRSPEFTAGYTDFQDNVVAALTDGLQAGEVVSGELGDIGYPVKPFYYEFSVADFVNSEAVVELTAQQSGYSIYWASDEVTEQLELAMGECDITVKMVYNSGTSDYTIAVTANVYTAQSDPEGGSAIETVVTSEPYAYTYLDGSVETPKVFGLLVDPISGFVRLYIDSVAWDNDLGYLLVDSVGGAHSNPNVNIGDLLKLPTNIVTKMWFQIIAGTDNTATQPATLEDYGSLKFNYTKEHFEAIPEDLPQNVVDIFGRPIVTLY